MPWFWQSESAEQKDARLRAEAIQKASLASLAKGGLPLEADRRLRRAAQQGDYSSNLS